jgi:hypothetical protein
MCQTCNGAQIVPITEMILIVNYEEVTVGFKPCPDCTDRGPHE